MRAPERRVRILRGHKDQARDMRFSDDGSRLASVSWDGKLIVWDVSTGKPLVIADTFEVGCSVDFSPDGHRVYTGGDDAIVADLGPVRRPAVPAPDVRAARRDRTSSTSTRRPTAGGWPTSRPTRPGSRSVSSTPSRERGRTRESPVSSRSLESGGLASRWSALRDLRRPAWRRHRAGCPDRRTDAPPPGGQGCGHLLDRLRRQGRTAGRRGRRGPSAASSTPTRCVRAARFEVAVGTAVPSARP